MAQKQNQSPSQNQNQSQAQNKREANGEAQRGSEVLGTPVSDLPYDMTVAGEPHDTMWDDMVNALKPDLSGGKQQSQNQNQNQNQQT